MARLVGSVHAMFPRALRIGSVAGVDVRIDPSWTVLAVLVALYFWGLVARRYGYPATAAAGMAIVSTLLFFGSVLGHELAHALEARHRGVRVSGITLFVFGGVTETSLDVRRPRDEFALSAVGPYASFVLAAILGIIATVAATYGLRPVADIAGLLAWLNLLLGVFNLLPGAPLDGGRVLRSAIWGITGDRRRAMRGAARAGQALGLALTLYGVWIIIGSEGAAFDGIWTAVIGWFLYRAASTELAQADTEDLLGNGTVGDVCDAPDWLLPAGATVAEVIRDVVRSTADVHAVGDDEAIVGVVTVDDLAAVEAERRPTTPVRSVMRPIGMLPTIHHDAALREAADLLSTSGVIAVVDDDGRLAGCLSATELDRAVGRVARLREDATR